MDLVELYGSAREMPSEAFQAHALRMLKPRLRFESAIWGFGRLTHPGLRPYRAHLHEVDPAGLEAWKNLNRADKVIPFATARPRQSLSFHAPTLFAGREDADMRDYALRYGRQSYMITAFPSSNPSLVGWISVYRPKADDQYQASERAWSQAVMPHYEEALLINQVTTAHRALCQEMTGALSLALVDVRGAIHFAQAGFLRLIGVEWPQADDQVLPREVARTLIDQARGVFLGRRVRVDAHRVSDLWVMRIRPLSGLDGLTPRRYEVAMLFGSGFSHKEIAQRLHVSPATVRSHIASIYGELSITSKAQLMSLARRG